MTLAEAVLAYAVQLMAATNNHLPYNRTVMEETVAAIAVETEDPQEAETLVKIARWDHGVAQGLFQVHPINKEEMVDTCSLDYRKQVRVALSHIRNSVEVCKMHGYRGSALLTIYTNGMCRTHSYAAFLRWGDGKALERFLYTEYVSILSKKGVVQLVSNAWKDVGNGQNN